MASCTGSGHRWIVCEIVPIKQAAADTGRLAHMTVATTGMAAGAVIAEHFLHAFVIGVRTTGFKVCPITLLRKMQIISDLFYFIDVTFEANFRLSLTRAGNQVGVCSVYPSVFYTAMAF
jgi:hypothetical protein